jgi:hypothetical protein
VEAHLGALFAGIDERHGRVAVDMRVSELLRPVAPQLGAVGAQAPSDDDDDETPGAGSVLAALLGVETVVRGTRSRVWLCARSAVLSPLWRALAAGDALFL